MAKARNTTKTIQEEKKKEYTDKELEELEREYKQHLGEFLEIHRKTPSVFVPVLCEDLMKAFPEMTNKEIQHRILEDCCGPEDWSRRTIMDVWPDWIKNPLLIEAGKAGQKAKHEAKARKNVAFAEQIAKPYEKIPEPVVEELKEQTITNDGYISGDADIEGKGADGKTIRSKLIAIRRSAQDLYASLSGELYMPVTDDFIVEHKRPTREFRSAIAHELNSEDRIGLYNWLGYAKEVAEDMMEIIREIDEKEATKKE